MIHKPQARIIWEKKYVSYLPRKQSPVILLAAVKWEGKDIP